MSHLEARQRGTTPIFVKGVSDFGDAEKDDDYQDYASYASARYVYEYLYNCLQLIKKTLLCVEVTYRYKVFLSLCKAKKCAKPYYYNYPKRNFSGENMCEQPTMASTFTALD